MLQQTQIDDASAVDLAFLCEALREGGALDVFSQPLQMKKGRLGTLVSALVTPERQEALRQVWWRHGTTLGLREQPQRRWVLPRREEQLETALGPVRLKWADAAAGRPPKPEFEDLAALARRHDLSLAEVRREVSRSLELHRERSIADRPINPEGSP